MIDVNNLLNFYEISSDSEEKKLDYEKKEVWAFEWSQDDPKWQQTINKNKTDGKKQT